MNPPASSASNSTAGPTQTPGPSKGRKLVLALLTITTTLAAALLIAEVALRLIPIPGIGYHTFYYDELTGGRHYPGSTVLYRNARGEHATRSVNSFGYLDAEHNVEKPDGITRIGFFGDSYVEAQQVPLENTFFRLIEAELNNAMPPPNTAGDGRGRASATHYECIAIGSSGYGTLQSYLEYGRWADSLDLDWVIYVFVENDPGDQLREIKRLQTIPYATLSGDSFTVDFSFRERTGHKTSPLHRSFQYLKSRSLVISTLVARATLLRDRGIKMNVTKDDMQMTETTTPDVITSTTPPSLWPPRLVQQAEVLGERVVTRWRRDARTAGRPFTILYIPRELEMEKPYDEQDGWAAWLSGVCQAQDIDLVDPSEKLAAKKRDGHEVYYDHFTREGHEAVAATLVDYFRGAKR